MASHGLGHEVLGYYEGGPGVSKVKQNSNIELDKGKGIETGGLN